MSALNLSPVGLIVRCQEKSCPECLSVDSIIGPGRFGEMVCIVCDRHRGWISKRTHDFFVGLIRHVGRPTEPITIRTPKREQHNSCVHTNERQHSLSQQHSKGVTHGLRRTLPKQLSARR